MTRDPAPNPAVIFVALLVGIALVLGIAAASSHTWQPTTDTQLITDTNVKVEFASEARDNISTTAPFPDGATVRINDTDISGAKSRAEIADLRAEEVPGNGTELRTQIIQATGSQLINRSGRREYVFVPYQDEGKVTHGGVIIGELNFNKDNSSVEHYYSADDSSARLITSFDTDLPEEHVLVAFDEGRGQALDSAVVQSDGSVAFVLPATSSTQINYKNGTSRINFTDSTGTLISQDLNATIRLYENYPDGDRIFVVGNTTNGTLDVSGVPTTIPLTVNINGSDSNYYARLAWLSSLEDQNTIYLINKTEYPNAPIVRFKVEDRSGKYGQDAVLYLQRGINTSDSPTGQLEYRTVAGDILGVSRSVSLRVIPGERYRIVLRSPDGTTRTRGPFVARASKEVVLEVGALDFSFNTPTDGPRLNLSRDVSHGGSGKRVQLALDYYDASNQTTDLEIVVHEHGNESNILTTLSAGSVANPLGRFTWTSGELTNESANTSWVADFEYRRNGTVTTGVKNFGPRQFSVGLPLGDGWKTIFSVGFLLVLGGAFSVGNARIGALIIPAVALLFWQIQWLTGATDIAAIAIAAAVAVAYNLIQTSGELIR